MEGDSTYAEKHDDMIHDLDIIEINKTYIGEP